MDYDLMCTFKSNLNINFYIDFYIEKIKIWFAIRNYIETLLKNLKLKFNKINKHKNFFIQQY